MLVITQHNNIKEIESLLYSRGITPKLVTGSGAPSLEAWRLGYTALKKHCNGGEPFERQCPI